jgi:hypothetical protein
MNIFVFRNSEKSLAYRRQVSGIAATAVLRFAFVSATGALRPETEGLLCPFDHGAAPTSAWRMERDGFNVNDDAELHVDEIVVGVSEERRSLVSPGPLGRGIGW